MEQLLFYSHRKPTLSARKSHRAELANKFVKLARRYSYKSKPDDLNIIHYKLFNEAKFVFSNGNVANIDLKTGDIKDFYHKKDDVKYYAGWDVSIQDDWIVETVDNEFRYFGIGEKFTMYEGE